MIQRYFPVSPCAEMLDFDFRRRSCDIIGNGAGRRGDYAYIHVVRLIWTDLCTTL